MITGAILVGRDDRQSDTTFRTVNPATGEPVGPPFSEGGAGDAADACALAAQAAAPFAALSPEARAAFIEAAAQAVLDVGEVLVETAMAESGLPRARLEGERMRTFNQLRMFAAELHDGHWIDATIDPALLERAPPRADLRRMNVALGPVAVFGASNFPLAFSVAGGNTASAFAAGCPVVVKGHPAHPGTGELVARAIRTAVSACGLPEGVFSYIPGSSNALGAALVADPRITAVGFTGSRAEPIPVYAEMASINPVVLLPGALEAGAEALAAGFVASLTLGAGQFCTNPGLVLALDSRALDRFIAAASVTLAEVEPPVMLTPGIHAAHARGVAALDAHAAARKAGEGQVAIAPNRCTGAVFEVRAADFLAHPELGAEVFGAASLVVRCATTHEMLATIAALEGQLTATIHAGADDGCLAAEVLPLLAARAGRVLANGWPTGVEVTRAMVHGGPWPATSDPRGTSVGTLAIARFLCPICYQDIPDALLPDALKAANPWGIPRRIDGEWQR